MIIISPDMLSLWDDLCLDDSILNLVGQGLIGQTLEKK